MSKKARIMILGTFHMRGSRDVHSTVAGDLTSQERQNGIRDLVERMKEFKPTKVAVEVERKKGEELNERYREYHNDSYELRVSEVDQIAFRVADELNHEKIHAIDWMEMGAGKRACGQVHQWAKENEPEFYERYLDGGPRVHDKSDKTILEIYRDVNNESNQKKTHENYINMARIGNREDYVGMDWLIWWYQRNLIIFSNLAEIAENGDSILLIIGGSHVQIVNQFLEESCLFEVVDVNEYLK